LAADPTLEKVMEMAAKMTEPMAFLNPKDVTDAVVYLLGNPPHVNVCELLIRPLHEAF
jgi:NADP-dependent 3-hydroxy acid dehydrogenase YdfG